MEKINIFGNILKKMEFLRFEQADLFATGTNQ